ncbi:MAG TPA: hypothetical protein VGB18_06755 [Candidatus Thermoplasmatota archaeon]
MKAKARAAGKRQKRRAAVAAKPPEPVPAAPSPPTSQGLDFQRHPAPSHGLDFHRQFVSLAVDERMRKLGVISATSPARPPLLPPIQTPVVVDEPEFIILHDTTIRLRTMHWVWTGLAYLTLIALATEAAIVLPADAPSTEGWKAFGIWAFFVVAAASVLVLSWRNHALPTIIVSFALFFLAWRAPFLSVGVFTDAADWTMHASPWWSLLVITLIIKSLETRGVRRRYHVRALMVLQGMQIATYAGLVLLSIFFLGRNGTIRAEWAITVIALVAAWMVQGRAVLTMWNLNVADSTTVEKPGTVWTSSAEHTGK